MPIVIFAEVEKEWSDSFHERMTALFARSCGIPDRHFQVPLHFVWALTQFAGVLRSTPALPQLLFNLMLWAHPTSLAIIAVKHSGEIILPTDPLRQNGPLLWIARQPLMRLRRSFGRSAGCTGFEPALDGALNAHLALLRLALSRMTPRQAEVCRTIEVIGKRKAAQAELGIGQSALSHCLKACAYRTLRDSINDLSKAIRHAQT